ncbi:transporter substrate-binding domain-containing protein [Gilvimarinus agarilyticus]|uniref:substrate-binding periplasmic protein n=1 Tax=Gilvimarinus sp. 2_MG-2023 TaxID=3062666 RepID=UPI001C09D783|nr:transporter substrate-binding domain-containing protein [Gilvimarinus sp. 2_MG-2023]MBU2887518.1 transporter substrate-binding domain-containing protein [Gilvimarinus agarilyticus]MDO6572169.1 transporter substrate-binding domain-containing protein [Gilvimarinus sp. 2_MG-2023]
MAKQLNPWVVMVLALVLLGGQPSWAQGVNRMVRIAAEDSWLPFSGPQGRGLSHQIAAEAFATQRYQLLIHAAPYARALRMVEQGQVDACWNVTRQANTEARFHFGTEPLLHAGVSFIYRADNVHPYTQIADIPNGTKIGVILGFEYGDVFERHKHRFKIQAVPTQKSLLLMLEAQRFDLVLMFDEVFAFNLDALELDPAAFIKGRSFYRSDIFIAFDASSPRSVVLSDALDKGLKHLRQTGRYAEIMNAAGRPALPSPL